MVYTMNRDSAANLTISSPLECHKSHTIVFDIVGVDVGFDNPIFAALELATKKLMRILQEKLLKKPQRC